MAGLDPAIDAFASKKIPLNSLPRSLPVIASPA
jgi:hypothetical protein